MRIILFTIALLSLAACSGGDSSEQHIARAKDFISAAEYPAASIELQNTLKLDGNSAEARWLLGKIYLDTGDILAAEKELQHAQNLGWTADDVRPAMAKTLLAQGKFADVLALESQDLSSASTARLLSIQVMAALSNAQTDKARELAALALHKEPQLLEAKLAQATIAVNQGDANGAMTLIEAILAGAPDTGEAWWLKGQILVQQGKLQDAQAAFDQSIAHSTIAFADRIARALVSVQLKDYEAAQTDVTKLLKLSPKDPAANYIQGLLDFRNKQYRKAISSLTLAKPAARQFPQILYYLSMGYLIDKNLTLAEQFGGQYVVLQPDDGTGRKLLAAIMVLQNKVKEAQKILQPVLDQNPDDVQALNIMANALLLNDQADSGMMLYARVAHLQPDWQFIPLRMEARQMTSGTAEETKQLPATTPDSAPNFPQADILSILNHLGKKDFPGAIEVATHYQLRDFESLSPYRVLGNVYLAAGQPANAKNAFEQVLKREPGDPAANLSLAEIALAANKPDMARHYYKTVLNYHPDNLATLLQLTALDAREKNLDTMVTLLNEAIEAHPMALEPRLRMADYYLSSGSPDKVASLFANLTAFQQRSPRVLELKALAQLAQKETDDALATLQQLVDTHPADARFQYLLAMAASETGDQQKSKQALMTAIRNDPKHIPSLIGLARISKREGEQKLFEQYLDTLVGLAPEAPNVLRLRALSAKANGNVVEALALSQRAFKQAPTTQTLLELTAYQKAAGENAAARNTLQQWIETHPADMDVRLSLANDLALENDMAGAQAKYLEVLKQEPGNITALNNLAWNMRLQNPEKALELIRSAIKISPDSSPQLFDTLAVIESINGDHKSAQKSIQRARVELPDDYTVRYHEAMIAAELGDKAQAIAALDELLKNDSGLFPERAEAEVLLKALKEDVQSLPSPG